MNFLAGASGFADFKAKNAHKRRRREAGRQTRAKITDNSAKASLSFL